MEVISTKEFKDISRWMFDELNGIANPVLKADNLLFMDDTHFPTGRKIRSAGMAFLDEVVIFPRVVISILGHTNLSIYDYKSIILHTVIHELCHVNQANSWGDVDFNKVEIENELQVGKFIFENKEFLEDLFGIINWPYLYNIINKLLDLEYIKEGSIRHLPNTYKSITSPYEPAQTYLNSILQLHRQQNHISVDFTDLSIVDNNNVCLQVIKDNKYIADYQVLNNFMRDIIKIAFCNDSSVVSNLESRGQKMIIHFSYSI